MTAPTNSLARSGAQTLVTSTLSVGLVFLTTVVVSRGLGPAGKGAYDLALATGALLTTLLGFSLSAGVTYVVARGAGDTRRLARTLAPIALVQGAVAAVVLVLVNSTALRSALLPSALGVMVVAPIAVLVSAGILAAELRAVVIGRRRFTAANGRDLATVVAQLSFVALAVGVPAAVHASPSPLMAVWASALSAVLGLGLYARAVAPERGPQIGPSGLDDAFRYSIRAHIANVAQFVNYSADLFFVSYFVGLSGVAFYALAVNIAQLVWLISWAAATVVFPHVAAHETGADEAAARSAQAARITAGGSIGAALVLGIAANLVIRIIFGAQFEPAVSAVYWLLPGIVALAVGRVVASYFAGIGRPDINATLSILGLIVTLPLDLLFIPTFGINGAAIASSVSYIATAAGTLALFCRRTGIPIGSVVLPTLADATAMAVMIQSLRPPGLGS